MVSTLSDLRRWSRALGTGALLKPARGHPPASRLLSLLAGGSGDSAASHRHRHDHPLGIDRQAAHGAAGGHAVVLYDGHVAALDLTAKDHFGRLHRCRVRRRPLGQRYVAVKHSAEDLAHDGRSIHEKDRLPAIVLPRRADGEPRLDETERCGWRFTLYSGFGECRAVALSDLPRSGTGVSGATAQLQPLARDPVTLTSASRLRRR